MEVSQVQQPSWNGRRRQGGWITFPFIIATTVGMNLAGGGWMINLIVYLIKEFNVKSIDAAQIANVVNGSLNLFPVLAAIIADSFLACFSVVWISSVISLLGIIILAVTASIPSLKPQPCVNGGSGLCEAPTRAQFGVLYGGICLATAGQAGRTVIAAMGAYQFPDKPKNQTIFFNWFFFTMYVAVLIASTVVVYVEDNVSWKCGFFICAGANVVALAAFLVGTPFYRRPKPEGSPCTGLARVAVAAIRKRKLQLSPAENNNFYYGKDPLAKFTTPPPSTSFGFLNRAAVKGNGDVAADGSNKKPWRLCSVREVEDFKTIIRIFPLWSSAIFLSTPIGMLLNLSILQALTMDRHLGRHFQIPAGSISVFVPLSTSISLILFDRILSPAWKRLAGKPPTPLQRVGIGHVFNVAGMAASAVVESKRRNASMGPISVMWLLPQLALVGIGEAMHFPGQLELYYQEFPASLKNVSTSLAWVIIAIAFYLSTALIDVVRRVTGWLPDNINHGRLENVYWLVAVVGVLNFAYFLTCSWFYKYQNIKEVGHDEPQFFRPTFFHVGRDDNYTIVIPWTRVHLARWTLVKNTQFIY